MNAALKSRKLFLVAILAGCVTPVKTYLDQLDKGHHLPFYIWIAEGLLFFILIYLAAIIYYWLMGWPGNDADKDAK